MGTKDPVLAPYQMYSTKDSYLNVACGNQRLWEQLCDAIDRPELKSDERFASNSKRVEHMDELEEELTATFETQTTDEWVELLAEEHELPVGPVFDVGEALTNEQVEARGAVTTLEHPAAGEIQVLEHPSTSKTRSPGSERHHRCWAKIRRQNSGTWDTTTRKSSDYEQRELFPPNRLTTACR